MKTTQSAAGLQAVNALQLWVETAGQGEPLLCISGLGYSSWCWAELREALIPAYRVITFDNRGTGRSQKPDGPYSITLLADDAAQVLDALGVAAAHVIGHSMGGYIAQTLALRHPARVRSLSLISTSAGGPAALPLPVETQRAWAAAAGLPPEESARRNMPISFAAGWAEANPELFEQYLQRRLEFPTPPACWLSQYNACVDYAMQGVEAERITQPTLVIHGDADRVVPFENGQLLARRVPNAQWEPLRGVGHLPYLEQREQVTTVIKKFLDGKSAHSG